MKKLWLLSEFLIVILVMTLLSGCFFTEDGPEDISAPVIEVHQPETGAYLETGTYILFETTLKDDLELGSYSIDVHDNLEGHSHGRIAQPSLDPSLIKWSFKRNYSIPDGLIIYEAEHDDDIEISANAFAGPYHFIVQAVDMAGNATSFQNGSTVEFEIFLTNTSQPVVNITNLFDDELDIKVSIPFIVEGDVTDPTAGNYAGMHSLEVILGEELEDEHQHNPAMASEDEHADLIQAFFEGPEIIEFMINGVIQLDMLFQSINFTLSEDQLDDLVHEAMDHLLLTINVRDVQGNLTVSKTLVRVDVN